VISDYDNGLCIYLIMIIFKCVNGKYQEYIHIYILYMSVWYDSQKVDLSVNKYSYNKHIQNEFLDLLSAVCFLSFQLLSRVLEYFHFHISYRQLIIMFSLI